MNSICVAVPTFNRPRELKELLLSVLAQTFLPDELLVVEDDSPLRSEIKDLCVEFSEMFNEAGISFKYIENIQNLGYDKNIRKCLAESNSVWTMLLGNDDVLLPHAVEDARNFIEKNDVDFISRSFLRFDSTVSLPLGISRIAKSDSVFHSRNSSANMIFRAAGFVGGLIVRTSFARKNATDEFDGSLYYQIYLAALAFCSNGIGYISKPIVGGRAGNPPMFGSSGADQEVHIPGSYTAKGRARMWSGVLKIAEQVEKETGFALVDDLKRELMVRQSFHIFEMYSGASKNQLRDIKKELAALGLFSHPFPKTLYLMNYLLGSHSAKVYAFARNVIQK